MTNTKETTLDLSYLYPKMLVVPSERYEKFYPVHIAEKK